MVKKILSVILIGVLAASFFGCSKDKDDKRSKDAADEAGKEGKEAEEAGVTKTGKDGAEMVLIPAGEFEMGTDPAEIPGLVEWSNKLYPDLDVEASWFEDETPRHTVYVDAFYMDKYEVTNAQYARFLNEYGKVTDPAGNTLIYIDNNWCKIIKDGDTYKPVAGYERHPVVMVSWYGAAAYAQHYGKRLPTEAEWERAARGTFVGEGKYRKYVWGDEWPPPKSAGNFADESARKKLPYWTIISGYDDGYAETAPVGSFNPNGYKLYDMAGNVWEWCADEYSSEYYSTSPGVIRNPKGPGTPVTFINNNFTNVNTPCVLRGGGWFSYRWYNLRVARRFYDDPYYADGGIGFRCSGL